MKAAGVTPRLRMDFAWPTDAVPRPAQIHIRTAELDADGVTRTYRYASVRTIASILAPRMADLVSDLAKAASRAPAGQMRRDDLILAMPGVVLSGPYIVVADEPGGVRTLSLEFREFIGDLQAVFAKDGRPGNTTLSRRESISVRTLEDVALPLLTMARALAAGHSAEEPDSNRRVMERLRKVAENAAGLEFQTTLLTRYVDACQPAWYDRYGTAPDPVERMSGMVEPPLPAFRTR